MCFTGHMAPPTPTEAPVYRDCSFLDIDRILEAGDPTLQELQAHARALGLQLHFILTHLDPEPEPEPEPQEEKDSREGKWVRKRPDLPVHKFNAARCVSAGCQPAEEEKLSEEPKSAMLLADTEWEDLQSLLRTALAAQAQLGLVHDEVVLAQRLLEA